MRTYVTVRGGRVNEVTGDVVREQPLTIYVNGEKFLTLLCSPMMLDALVVGYLWMEKVIGGVDEIARLDISAVDGRADVTLTHRVTLPTERILTSGCGGGITFRIDHRLFPRLDSTLRVRPAALAAGMKQLFDAATQYQRSRGIHGAALSDGTRLLLVAEDVGRHNAVDKVVGAAVIAREPIAGRGLLVTGRISAELAYKAARAGLAYVATPSVPSTLALTIARRSGMVLVGRAVSGTPHIHRPDA